MWKAKGIKGRWALVYHTNNRLYGGLNIFPTINIGYVKTKKKYSYTYQFWIEFDWLFFAIAIKKLSQ
jgi:hypothetical protein